MEKTEKIEEIRERVKSARTGGKRIGFVPTMGALHEGHLSLVQKAREHCDYIVLSIYLNPLQFDNKADLGSYPKTLDRDLVKAEDAGVDCVFFPSDEIMYHDQKTFVEVQKMTGTLCGATRPGHFTGVFTVVTKLFNIVQPDLAFFGQKDIQQARSIEKMVFDLNMPLEIVIAPIIREKEGLALSSRNVHLSPEQKKRALCLYKALKAADNDIQKGIDDAGSIIENITSIITSTGKPDRIDYISVVDYETLQPVQTITGPSIIAVAVFFGTTRLIDNWIINK